MSVLPPQHQRVGAHRARRNPLALTATAAVAFVFLFGLLVWGLSSSGVFGGGDQVVADAGNGVASEAPDSGIEVEPDAAPESVEASAPATTQEAPPPTQEPTSEPTQEPEPVVDRSVSVAVLNGGANQPGIASETAASLIAAGWTGVDESLTTNADDFPDVPATQVFYGDPALAATAEAVVADLGVGSSAEADMAANGWTTSVVVVMGQDFPLSGDA